LLLNQFRGYENTISMASTTVKIDATAALGDYCHEVAVRAKRAATELQQVSGQAIIDWLVASAQLLRSQSAEILAANEKDLKRAPEYGLTSAQIDRLKLTEERIKGIASGLEEVAALPSPVGAVMRSTIRPNGLRIDKVRVPLGVVFFIYEARPNVTADAAAICVKAGNAVILRGGKEAFYSSQAIISLLAEAARKTGVPADAVQLVQTTDRAAVGHFLSMPEEIDVAIPRGGESLIRRVVAEARMPVIKHFDGNCHVYVDKSADLVMAEQILINGKCQRMGVCNATESLLVHAEIAEDFLPGIGKELIQRGIEVRGDKRVCDLIDTAILATEQDYKAEFLGPILSVCVVSDVDAAIAHINRFGSHHTDAIVTGDLESAEKFAAQVDSSAVMINASTRFNDGGEFGLGAEIGISTDKFHARGPCGLEELTSYKYIVHGTGQIRG
jgi:glutamate-5-semialdehyde dehydrogenase